MDLVHVKCVFLGAVIFNRPILDRTHIGDDGGRQSGIEHHGLLSADCEEVVGGAVGAFGSFGKVQASLRRDIGIGQTGESGFVTGEPWRRNAVLWGT